MSRWYFWPSASQQVSVMQRLWLRIVLLMAYAGIVEGVDLTAVGHALQIPSTLHALLGGLVGVLLVFRTNTAYDRWWEGRKLWGQLVNDSRNLAVKVRSLRGIDRDEARRFGRMLVNFALALKEHLREGIRPKQLSLYQNAFPTAAPQHVPLHIATLVREQIARWRQQGAIDHFDELILDPHARALLDICGSCERIRKTPLVQSYRTFVRRMIGLYFLTLPWGLCVTLQIWTVPITGLIAYFMLGLELTAEDVEEPFGRGADDLLLDEICRTLEASVTEVFQEEPAAPVPSGLEAGLK
jgi:ion channel-forming bestrophin family protein